MVKINAVKQEVNMFLKLHSNKENEDEFNFNKYEDGISIEVIEYKEYTEKHIGKYLKLTISSGWVKVLYKEFLKCPDCVEWFDINVFSVSIDNDNLFLKNYSEKDKLVFVIYDYDEDVILSFNIFNCCENADELINKISRYIKN